MHTHNALDQRISARTHPTTDARIMALSHFIVRAVLSVYVCMRSRFQLIMCAVRNVVELSNLYRRRCRCRPTDPQLYVLNVCVYSSHHAVCDCASKIVYVCYAYIYIHSRGAAAAATVRVFGVIGSVFDNRAYYITYSRPSRMCIPDAMTGVRFRSCSGA